MFLPFLPNIEGYHYQQTDHTKKQTKTMNRLLFDEYLMQKTTFNFDFKQKRQEPIKKGYNFLRASIFFVPSLIMYCKITALFLRILEEHEDIVTLENGSNLGLQGGFACARPDRCQPRIFLEQDVPKLLPVCRFQLRQTGKNCVKKIIKANSAKCCSSKSNPKWPNQAQLNPSQPVSAAQNQPNQVWPSPVKPDSPHFTSSQEACQAW